MEISTNKVVAIDYALKADSGELLDSSEGGGPLQYLQGHGNIIAGLEKELEGKAAGAELQVRIAPEDAYGIRNEELIQKLPRDVFSGVDKIETGMQFQMQSPQGTAIVTVTELGDEEITVDGNHPLAGQHLNFDVTVREVRAASEEEIENGQVHDPGEPNH